jgi:Kef-type K+ transport system membrane component KefB
VRFLDNFHFPITDPVLTFLLIFIIIFLGPRILKRIRIPGIVGFILAGVLLGPHGLNIVSDDTGIKMFASFGLLYIMFLVGLEIDLVDFKKNQSRSFVFGALTFLIPLTMGFFVTYYILKLGILASLLLSSMFSTHTLVSYPIASKLGITKSRVMNIVVGGTMITDTAVLLLLAIIVRVYKGTSDFMFWSMLITMLTAYIAIMLWVVPKISRWFFKHMEGDGSAQYLYLMVILFASAFLSEVAGIEPMIGAFLAGLALNSLIPQTSVLMNRTVFIGNTIFIPFFLIGVGMLVDLRVLFNGYNALLIAGVLVVTAEITKYSASYITQKIYGFTRVERNVMFGLSSSHAAATIALILVGFNIGLLNIDVLNGTVLVILVSCLVSSFVTENAGRKLAVTESTKPVELLTTRQKILVPVANQETMEQLIKFAILIHNKTSKEPVYPLNVVTGNMDLPVTQTEILEKNAIIESIASQAVTDDHSVHMVTRIDLNVANGINRAIKELMATDVVLGWNGQTTTAQSIFGGILENVLPKNNQMIFVVKVLQPFGYFNRLVVIVPQNAQYEPGYQKWIRQVMDISKEISAKILVFANGETLEQLKIDIRSRNITISFVEFHDFSNLNSLQDHLSNTDLLMWISARNSTISFNSYLSMLPRNLSKNFKKNSFIIIYPEQHSVRHQNSTLRLDGLTSSPIQENIERISKIGKEVKKVIRGKTKR